MKNLVDIINLESQVTECYSYFMNNHKDYNHGLDDLEGKIRQLHSVMTQLTITNLVNIIERVVEDGRKNKDGDFKQYNVSSIQLVDEKINLICHEVLGVDSIDKKFILDNIPSYIDFTKVTRIY